MKNCFFIALFIVCVNIVTASCQLQAKSSVEQLVHIMIRDTKDDSPYLLTKNRNPSDYQDVYNLATKHPKLLNGIIHDGQTFAMLCVKRGYADLLASLIKEGYPVDLATPCYECGPDNPQTTVLHIVFRQIMIPGGNYFIRNCFPEDYIASIEELAKLIINKCPDLLDAPLNRAPTARSRAREWNLY